MIRQFKNNLKETGMVLGQLFMPLLENLLPALNGLTIAFKRLFTSIASVFGIKINLEEFGEGYTETEDTLGDIADSYDEATSAAKKYQNQILGFDEVTKLQDTSATDSGSSGGAGGTIDLTDEILKATEEYEKAWEEAYDRMENKANSIADRISKAFSDGWKDSDFSSIGGYVGESFNKSLEGMNWSSIKKTAKKISTSFATLLNGFFATPNLFSNIGTSIAEGLNTAVMMSSTFAGTLDWSEMGNSIASGINNFFDTFDFSQLADSINLWVDGIEELIITAFSEVDFLDILNGLVDFISNLEIDTGLLLGLLAIAPLAGIISSINGAFYTLSTNLSMISGFFTPIITFVSGLSAPILILIGVLGSLVLGLGYVFKENEEVQKGFEEAKEKISNGLQPIIEFFTNTIIPDLKNAWKGLLDILKPFGDFLETVFASIWNDIISPALSYLGEKVLPILYDSLSGLWEDVLVPLGSFVGGILKDDFKIFSDVLTILWKEVVVPVAKILGGVFAGAFESLFSIINGSVIPAFGALSKALSFFWNSFLSPIVNFLWDVFKPAFLEISKSIGSIINGITKSIGGITDFISGVFTGNWSRAWNGIKNIFSGIWDSLSAVVAAPLNAIIGLFEGFINAMIKGWNSLVSALNKFSIKIPDWVPEIGGKKFGFDIKKAEYISIPRFATGGFPEDGLFYANHEELVGQFSNGKTAVANNEQITQGIANAVYPAVYNAVSQAMRSNSSGNADVVVNIDGKEVFHAVQTQATNYTRRTGKLAFPV